MSQISSISDQPRSLVLDFANTGKVSPIVNNLRASAAFEHKLTSNVLAAADTPRLYFNRDSGVCEGLLHEGPATNLIPSNQDLTHATWSPANVTSVVDNTYGAPYPEAVVYKVTSIDGIESAKGQRAYIPVSGLTGRYVFSVCYRFGETRKPYRLRLRVGMRKAVEEGYVFKGDVTISSENLITAPNEYKLLENLGNGWYRAAYIFDITSDVIGLDLGMWQYVTDTNWTAPGGDRDVWLTGWQLEKANYPTSVIFTNGTEVTRASDNQYVDVAPYLNSNGFTVAYVARSGFESEYPVIFSDRIDTLNKYIGVRHASGGTYINSIEGSRTNAVARARTNERCVVVASFSEQLTHGYNDGRYMAPTTNTPIGTDYATRRYMKFNQLLNYGTGRSVLERVIVIPKVLNQSELLALHNLMD